MKREVGEMPRDGIEPPTQGQTNKRSQSTENPSGGVKTMKR